MRLEIWPMKAHSVGSLSFRMSPAFVEHFYLFIYFTFWNNKIFLSPLVLFCPHPEVSPFFLGAPGPFVENGIQKPTLEIS